MICLNSIQKWAKFGDERGKKAGPDLSTTSIDQQIFLKLSTTGKVCEVIFNSFGF